MSGSELLSRIRKERTDDIPSFLYDTSLGTAYANIDVCDIYANGFDGELSAKSISAGRRALGHDGIIGSLLCTDCRAFGAEYEYYPDRQPMLVKPAFEDPMDMEYYSPYDMDTDAMDECIRSYQLVRKYEPDAAIAATIPSVLLMAATIRGAEALMMDMSMDKYAFKETMNFARGIVNLTSERILDEGTPDFVVIPGAYDNVDLLGIEGIEEHCLMDLSRIYYDCKGHGLDVVFHPHGVLTSDIGKKALRMFINVGFDCIYYGEGNDHRMIGELCQNEVTMMGGVDSATTIFLGPDERVRNDTMNVLEAMQDKDFIYSCSCSVDRGLDPHRMELMMSLVKGYHPL